MSIRGAMATRPLLTGAAAVVLRARCLAALGWQAFGHRELQDVYRDQAFFSDDDGRTWFFDSVSRVPPFDHSGRPADRAVVCRCGDGQPFIGYSKQYSPAQVARLAQMAKEAARQGLSPPVEVPSMPMEVKRPGAGKRVSGIATGENFNAEEYNSILAPRCPDGIGHPREVLPYESDVH